MTTGLLHGLRPGRFRTMTVRERSALMLVSNLDALGMVLEDAEGREKFMLIIGDGGEWLFDLVALSLKPL